MAGEKSQETAAPTDLDAMARYAEIEALERAQKQQQQLLIGDASAESGAVPAIAAAVTQKRKAAGELQDAPSKLAKGSNSNSEELDI